VRVIGTVTRHTTWAEFEAAYTGQTYQALESAWAGATYSGFENSPLGRI
jgi:CobQ-like glutamine amidotransferase family enzyme